LKIVLDALSGRRKRFVLARSRFDQGEDDVQAAVLRNL
jgi:hypothetical protein